MEMNDSLHGLLQPSQNVQLEFLDETGKKYIYRTTIAAYTDDQLSLFMPLNDLALRNIQPDTKITVIFRNEAEQHDYVFTSQLLKIEPGQPRLIIESSSEIEFAIGRRFFRCEVNLPFDFFTKKEKFTGQVLNLSANGLYAVVSPSLHVEPGTGLTCHIILPTSTEPILFSGNVVRVIKKESFQGIGLSFQHVTKNLQDQITKYLFQRQRALINLGQIKIVKKE